MSIPREQLIGWLLLFVLACLFGCTEAPPADQLTEPSEPHQSSTAAVGASLFATHCASCHENPDIRRAVPLASLSLLGPAQVAFAMSNGIMKSEAAALSPAEQMELTVFIAGEGTRWAPEPGAFCDHADGPSQDMDLTPRFSRWAVDAQATGSLAADSSTINAGNIRDLELASRLCVRVTRHHHCHLLTA